MLVVEKIGRPIKKKKPPSLIKKKNLSWLTVSLLSRMEQTPNLLAKILKKLEKIVAINY